MFALVFFTLAYSFLTLSFLVLFFNQCSYCLCILESILKQLVLANVDFAEKSSSEDEEGIEPENGKSVYPAKQGDLCYVDFVTAVTVVTVVTLVTVVTDVTG